MLSNCQWPQHSWAENVVDDCLVRFLTFWLTVTTLRKLHFHLSAMWLTDRWERTVLSPFGKRLSLIRRADQGRSLRKQLVHIPSICFSFLCLIPLCTPLSTTLLFNGPYILGCASCCHLSPWQLLQQEVIGHFLIFQEGQGQGSGQKEGMTGDRGDEWAKIRVMCQSVE